jgi:hypothetical protein
MATLVNMRTQAVREADALGNLSLADATDKAYVDSYINAGLQRLHDLLTGMYQDYQVTGAASVQITNVATAQFALPNTAGAPLALKVRDVEWLGTAGTTEAVSLDPFAWTERNRIQLERQYCIVGELVLIRPAAQSLGFYKVWYTPRFTPLVADADAYDAVNGWESIAITEAAIQIKTDQEKDTTVQERKLDRLMSQVHEAASKRVSGKPGKVRRVKRSLYERMLMADVDPDRFG